MFFIVEATAGLVWIAVILTLAVFRSRPMPTTRAEVATTTRAEVALTNPQNGHHHPYGEWVECPPCAVFFDTAWGDEVLLQATGRPVPEYIAAHAARSRCAWEARQARRALKASRVAQSDDEWGDL
jgi:hypothetical protein